MHTLIKYSGSLQGLQSGQRAYISACLSDCASKLVIDLTGRHDGLSAFAGEHQHDSPSKV